MASAAVIERTGSESLQAGRAKASVAPLSTSATQLTSSKPLSRRWSPRFFQGTDAVTWAKILFKNRFAVHPKFWYIAGIVSINSTINLALRWVQNGLYGNEISRVPIDKEPIFVIGHWRTGTTLLHELLIQDDQFHFPDFFACFNPNHRLISEKFFKTYGTFLAPEQRPMDNMAAGWDRPQEDEFALCLLGLPSSYADLAFPNNAPMYPGALDLSGLTPRELKRWKQTFRYFLQTLMFRDPRRLILKSPPHTARIPVLLDMFPDARFVHIVRDPYVVFPSTVNLWKSLARGHCFHAPNNKEVEEKVLREYRIIYDRLEEARPLIRSDRFHELRYEELIADPVGELEKVYSSLQLEGFENARPRVEQYLQQTSGYETNKYSITNEQRMMIDRRWGDVVRRYGYW
jgi:hypothetical protein